MVSILFNIFLLLYKMNYSFLLHNAAIEVILLLIIMVSYYSKKIPKDYMTICLLGTYILGKAITNGVHYLYHSSEKP
jgi:hypothetical protein